MAKQTFASVTEIACTCRFLEREAQNPDIPIEFDQRTNEFHFVWTTGDGPASLVLYHCPFCGGVAPESKRDSLFAFVTHAEVRRLNDAFADVKTLDDAIAKFGPPDEDMPHGISVRTPEEGEKPSVIRSYRTIRYSRLSDTADVHLVDYQSDRVSISYQGKHLASADKR